MCEDSIDSGVKVVKIPSRIKKMKEHKPRMRVKMEPSMVDNIDKEKSASKESCLQDSHR